MSGQVGGHPRGASHPPRGTPSQLAGSSSRRLGGGSCLLRVAPRGAGAVGDAAWHGAAWGRRGAGLGHKGAGATRCLLLPFPCHPGLAYTTSPWVNRSCAGELATSCHCRQSKGRGAAQGGGCWKGGGSWAGGPPECCTPTGTTAMAGQSLPCSGWGALSLWCPHASSAWQSHPRAPRWWTA